MAKVTMFTTQVCPYCIRAKQLLKARGVEQIDEVRIDLDPAQRDAMMARTGRRTVPQIYIGDTPTQARNMRSGGLMKSSSIPRTWSISSGCWR